MNEPPTVEKIRDEIGRLAALDYVVLVAAFVGCVLFGIYYSFWGYDTDIPRKYLMGGRNMNSFSVAASLVASAVARIPLLGVPSEVYLHGTEYAFVFIPVFLTGLVSSYLILPVFYEMQLLSIYEYLERRFDRSVRIFGSLMFAVVQIFWLPVVVYLSALSINQVSGVHSHIVTPCVCLICIFYTCLGGMRAVVWTDLMLTSFMVCSLILVCTKGSLDVGGFNSVWQRNYEGGRLVYPTFEADLTVRHSVWAITFGGLFMWVQWSVFDQRMFQRYLSPSSLSQARRVLWLSVFGTIALILLCCYAGLVTYAVYHDCDPLTTKLAKGNDQLLPLLVMRVFENLPGLSGLFLAGTFSASMNSLSTGLNALSAVVLEDFVKPFSRKGLSPHSMNLTMRGVVVIFGIFLLYVVSNIEKLRVVLQFSTSLGSITSGPVLGVFFAGVFLPWVNAKGALFGGLFGLFASGFLIIGAENASARTVANTYPKPTSVEGCLYYYNATVLSGTRTSSFGDGAVFPLFKLGYFWHTTFGGFITVTLALIISALTGFTDLSSVDPVLLSPVVRPRLPFRERLTSKERLLIRELERKRGWKLGF